MKNQKQLYQRMKTSESLIRVGIFGIRYNAACCQRHTYVSIQLMYRLNFFDVVFKIRLKVRAVHVVSIHLYQLPVAIAGTLVNTVSTLSAIQTSVITVAATVPVIVIPNCTRVFHTRRRLYGPHLPDNQFN